jgi:hypothetical protein
MFVIVLLMGIALQADTPICSGNGDERNCKSEDGSTYIERRLVDQVIREGTAPDGSSYTEYITRVFDGSRLEGVDSTGHHWSQQCNPRFGTTGTDRTGKTIYIPPPARIVQPEDRSGPVGGPVSNPLSSIQTPPTGGC